MSKKGWLSKSDFEKLDDLFGKLGYGGYYDFLECLKIIAREIGARNTKEGAWDLMDFKTILEVMTVISVWSGKVSDWRMNNPDWIDEILKGEK